MNALVKEKKRRTHTWGSIFNNALARGYDHGYAAYLADKWEERKKRRESEGGEMSDQVMTPSQRRYRRREAIQMRRTWAWWIGLREHNYRVLTNWRALKGDNNE